MENSLLDYPEDGPFWTSERKRYAMIATGTLAGLLILVMILFWLLSDGRVVPTDNSISDSAAYTASLLSTTVKNSQMNDLSDRCKDTYKVYASSWKAMNEAAVLDRIDPLKVLATQPLYDIFLSKQKERFNDLYDLNTPFHSRFETQEALSFDDAFLTEKFRITFDGVTKAISTFQAASNPKNFEAILSQFDVPTNDFFRPLAVGDFEKEALKGGFYFDLRALMIFKEKLTLVETDDIQKKNPNLTSFLESVLTNALNIPKTVIVEDAVKENLTFTQYMRKTLEIQFALNQLLPEKKTEESITDMGQFGQNKYLRQLKLASSKDTNQVVFLGDDFPIYTLVSDDADCLDTEKTICTIVFDNSIDKEGLALALHLAFYQPAFYPSKLLSTANTVNLVKEDQKQLIAKRLQKVYQDYENNWLFADIKPKKITKDEKEVASTPIVRAFEKIRSQLKDTLKQYNSIFGDEMIVKKLEAMTIQFYQAPEFMNMCGKNNSISKTIADVFSELKEYQKKFTDLKTKPTNIHLESIQEDMTSSIHYDYVRNVVMVPAYMHHLELAELQSSDEFAVLSTLGVQFIKAAMHAFDAHGIHYNAEDVYAKDVSKPFDGLKEKMNKFSDDVVTKFKTFLAGDLATTYVKNTELMELLKNIEKNVNAKLELVTWTLAAQVSVEIAKNRTSSYRIVKDVNDKYKGAIDEFWSLFAVALNDQLSETESIRQLKLHGRIPAPVLFNYIITQTSAFSSFASCDEKQPMNPGKPSKLE